MKALSLWQPHATLVAVGAKPYETRSWSTDYRGPLAIHATVAFPKQARLLCGQEPFRSALRRNGYDATHELPFGAIVALVRLVDCVPTSALDLAFLSDEERAFGDFSERRFAWKLELIHRLLAPIPARGHQRLWGWDAPGWAVAMATFHGEQAGR